MSNVLRTLEFLKRAERLKDVTRSAHTSSGRRESVAEHSWRLCLMALAFEDDFPGVDLKRLLQICIVHDLGEAIGGDIPAPDQDPSLDKLEVERRDLLEIVNELPDKVRRRIVELWEEYAACVTREAKLAKAFDRLETILQHNQGKNASNFDYRFNLAYGKEHTSAHPVLEQLRDSIDVETLRRIADQT